MILRVMVGLALAASFAGAPQTVFAEQKGAAAVSPGGTLDAVPDTAAPDPLTPPEKKVTPVAPGVPEEKPAESAQAPVSEPDPLAKAILAKLGSAAAKGDAREDIAGLSDYYKQHNGQPIWTSAEGFNAQAKNAIREIRNADEWGLEASAFQIPTEPKSGASPELLAEAELKLSLAVLKYARYARGGRLDPPSLSEVLDRTPHVYEPKSVLLAIAAAEASDAYLRGLHPKHEQFKRLRQALIALRKGGQANASSAIPAGPDLRPGDNHPQIALIRKRLGVPASGGRETDYDRPLLQAVSRYQSEQGLDPTGIIDRKLRAALNGSSASAGSTDEQRMRILVNMERWRWMPDNLGEFYVWDSITEQYTRVFDHGKMVLMEKIVVGKPNTPTPSFTANMQFIVFHPEWGVPDGIKINEIAPKLRNAGDGGGFFFGAGGGGGASEILERYKLRVSLNGRPVDPDSVDWSSADIRRYQFIQPAGPTNVLGVVKFRFPNKHDVYMHDTPDRNLFGAAPRAFSHGCMRTQNPVHLAEVLLAHDKGYSVAQVHQILDEGVTNEIKLSTEIPVHIVYFTAEVGDDGKLHYFPDIYGLDSRVASALKGQPVRLPSDAVASAETGDPRSRQRDDGSSEQSRRYSDPYGDPYRSSASSRRREWNFFDWN